MKIMVKALKPHMRHGIGDHYPLPMREAKVLEGLGYVATSWPESEDEAPKEPPKKRTYKRRDMKAE